MEINKDGFFREATLRLCSNLHIEQGLKECVNYLKKFMPADALYLERLEKEYNAIRILARATSEKGEAVDFLAPLPESARAALTGIEEAFLKDGLPGVIIVNDPQAEPITKAVQQYLEVTPSSVMSMPLIVGGQLPGTLALIAEGSNRYTEKDARLFELLKEPFFVAISNNLKHRKILDLLNLLQDDNKYYQNEFKKLSGNVVLGADFGLKQVMDMVRKVAPLNSSVLIQGETGSGKEVIANAIHNLSPRRDKPFIKVNCGAIPESLMDSELFGHEKGAFTGAVSQSRGRFERAHTGTIFLDEIGELTAEVQVRLLRVLQEKTIERIGGTSPIDVDIRIIAATHRDLTDMVKKGTFREDLYFRLKVFPIEIPSLMERRGDIPALVQHIIRIKSQDMKLGSIPKLAPGAIDILMAYDWPGNVRELENVIERELILNREGILSFLNLLPAKKAPTPQPWENGEKNLELDQVMAKHIKEVLQLVNGRVEGKDGAAVLLNIHPATLRNRMKKLGISFGRIKK